MTEPSYEPLPSLLLTVPEVAAQLRLSRAKVYTLIRRKVLPVVRLDKSVRVSAASLQQWIQRLEDGDISI